MRRTLVSLVLVLVAAASRTTGALAVPAPPYREVWRVSLDAPASGATIADGVAWVVTADAVIGFDVETGARRSSFARSGPLLRPGVGSVAGRAVLVYVDGGAADDTTTADGPAEVVAIDLADASEPWRTAFEGGVPGGVTVAGDAAYLVDGDGVLTALSLADGSARWTARVGRSDAAPVVADGTVFAAGAPRGAVRVRAFDAATGERRWSQPTRYGVGSSSALAVDATTVAFAAADRLAYAVDAATGATSWEALVLNVPSPVAAPALSDDAIFFTDYAGGVYRFDRATGERAWDHQLNALTVRSAPVLVGDAVALGTNDGRLVAIDATSGRLVADVRLGDGIVGALATTDDLLLAPVGGRSPALVALSTDPTGERLDVASPTVADPVAIVGRFALVAAVMLGAAGIGGRAGARRRRGGAPS